MTVRSWTSCSAEEFPQKEIQHCGSCHDEWEDYDRGVIDHDHRMDAEMKDGRVLIYCCSAKDWFEEKDLLT